MKNLNLEDLAYNFSKKTELIESFDWNEEKAELAYKEALELVATFPLIDEKIDREKFLDILKINVSPITDLQFKVLVELLDDTIEKFLILKNVSKKLD